MNVLLMLALTMDVSTNSLNLQNAKNVKTMKIAMHWIIHKNSTNLAKNQYVINLKEVVLLPTKRTDLNALYA
jgi:hypothetical protein